MTVQDVADRAGVGKATAARALGGYGAVSPEVQRRVEAAALALGYRPNGLARSMSTGRTNTIGVVVGDIENPFFGLAVRGISDVARQRGFDVVLSNTGEQVEVEQSAVRTLLDRRVDGLIVSAANSAVTAHLSDILAMNRPLVLLDRLVPAVVADAVVVDNFDAARTATAHLLEAGHRRIAFISSSRPRDDEQELIVSEITTSTVRDRLTAFIGALDAAGVREPASLVRLGATGYLTTRQIVANLLALPDVPTAIVASDSVVALNVLRSLRDLGVDVPGRVSLIMFDDADWATVTSPPLTVIAQPIYDLGSEAARRLLDRLDGRTATAPTSTFTARLIPRGSVARVVG